ncbi:aromatic aminobenezylarsenical efflux permease ArsG family transporter [Aquisphaera insulae]|uniref:aromatic aminobenezylarsenical efflux permease ArsG family transporter n=1 Tax=Aquisphaera insulae TaxID=2712864 RepID=UPI0013EB30C4|nr:aromatic aminobenezylarsenical efflux permease ArsG family transporter [Aquisphaera insulae]
MTQDAASISRLAAASAALWLGILTSISPCPLATNVAAVSFIGRRVGSPRRVFLSGVLYALGRSLAYLGLAGLLVASALSVPEVSMFLQRSMNKLLGPLLVLVAMFLLDLISLSPPGSSPSESMQRRLDALGLWGALPLGMLLALTFCPVSAALFFGSLVPLSVKAHSSVLLPGVYGLGTALPALVFAGLVAAGTRSVSKAFHALTSVEWWARRLTGIVFLGIGFYYSLKFVFGVL